MREKAKASLVQRTSSRWWLVSVHLIWPRLSAIISFHAATLASGTRKASSVSDLRDRWFRSIGQAHRNFDPSPQPPRFSFDSFFLSFFLASVSIFLILPNSRSSLNSTIWSMNNLWTLLDSRYPLSNLFQISIAVPSNRQFINSYYNRQDLESDFHCVFNWIPYYAFLLFITVLHRLYRLQICIS